MEIENFVVLSWGFGWAFVKAKFLLSHVKSFTEKKDRFCLYSGNLRLKNF